MDHAFTAGQIGRAAAFAGSRNVDTATGRASRGARRGREPLAVGRVPSVKSTTAATPVRP